MRKELGKTFRQYLELTEPRKFSYLGAMADELDIDPEELEKVPQVAANFSLGGSTYNLGALKVLGYIYDDNGNPKAAKVQMMDDPAMKVKRFKKVDGQYARLPTNRPDAGIFVIPINKLNALMTQGLDQQGAGAGGPPMPGGM